MDDISQSYQVAGHRYLMHKIEKNTKVSLTLEQINLIKMEVLKNRPYAARISLALIVRLANYEYAHCVLDEIDYLEGIRPFTITKDETQFRSAELNPFWHKHFTTPHHILKNVLVRWGLHKLDDVRKTRDLDEVLKIIANDYGNSPEEWQRQLADKFITKAFYDRAEQFGLTGDWIIYAKHEGSNYYLDLATHEEGTPENVKNLQQKLRSGNCVEFPFLFEELENK